MLLLWDPRVCPHVRQVPWTFRFSFWPGLGFLRPKAIVVIPKINPCQNRLRKKRVKVRSTPGHYATKNRSVEITMHLGLDNIIKIKFTINFDRCAILNVLNCLSKNFLGVTSLLITRN